MDRHGYSRGCWTSGRMGRDDRTITDWRSFLRDSSWDHRGLRRGTIRDKASRGDNRTCEMNWLWHGLGRYGSRNDMVRRPRSPRIRFLTLWFLKVAKLVSQLIHSCHNTPQFTLTIIHVSLKPFVQTAHVPHEFSLLINRCQLSQTILPQDLHKRVEQRNLNNGRSRGHGHISRSSCGLGLSYCLHGLWFASDTSRTDAFVSRAHCGCDPDLLLSGLLVTRGWPVPTFWLSLIIPADLRRSRRWSLVDIVTRVVRENRLRRRSRSHIEPFRWSCRRRRRSRLRNRH